MTLDELLDDEANAKLGMPELVSTSIPALPFALRLRRSGVVVGAYRLTAHVGPLPSRLERSVGHGDLRGLDALVELTALLGRPLPLLGQLSARSGRLRAAAGKLRGRLAAIAPRAPLGVEEEREEAEGGCEDRDHRSAEAPTVYVHLPPAECVTLTRHLPGSARAMTS